MILERYDLGEILRVVIGLYETTAYKVRWKEGLSEGVTRERFEGGGMFRRL